MIMLVKTHHELIEKAQNTFHDKGYANGYQDAEDSLKSGFKKELSICNNINTIVKKENVELTLKIKRLENELYENKKEFGIKCKIIEGLEKFSDRLQDEVCTTKVLVSDSEKKVDILKFYLRCEYNKDIARYENIAKRTKKARIREKAKRRIEELKELELAFS